jgi:uncharacterized hydrophobic protein (TIGR00271 family)
MLQLRAYGETGAMAAVAEELERLDGVRHVAVFTADRAAGQLLSADVRAGAADDAFRILGRHGVQAEDVVFSRLDTIGALPDATDALALVWADVLGQAQTRARAPGRYFVLMAAAGVVGTYAVINRSPVLIVGAMAMSPDLLPITAACTGLALGRARLSGRALGTLVAGLAVIGVVATGLAAVLKATGLMPDGFTLGEIPAGQTQVNTSTILIALAAGVAGMLAVETRASAAVGVAISVTTVPAAAFFGVAAGIGEVEKAPSALAVLGVNVTMMLLGGSCTLVLQRVLERRVRGTR